MIIIIIISVVFSRQYRRNIDDIDFDESDGMNNVCEDFQCACLIFIQIKEANVLVE